MIWYVFPVEKHISWEGHLAGLITGFVFAVIFRKAIAKPERYVWQQPEYNEDDDPFLKHFDEHGNFIENPDLDLETEENAIDDNNDFSVERSLKVKPKITYIYKKSKPKD